MQEKLSLKKRKAIAGLLSQRTVDSAAEVAGVNPASIYRWIRDDVHFREGLATAESEAISEAARSMAAAARESVDYLRSVLQDDEVSTSEKIRAALGLLSAMPPLRILGSIEQRLEALKETKR